MKAAIYARVSTDRQETETQTRILKDRCAVAGWTVVAEYTEEESASHGDRNAYNRMMADARARKWDILLFWAWDRVTRGGSLATLSIMNALDRAGVARIEIERTRDRIRVDIHTARPGIVIGRRGAEAERIRTDLEKLTKPAKMQIINGCIFRQKNPAVVGVEILGGKLRKDVELIKLDGSNAGYIKSMQLEQKEIAEPKRGDQVAISLPGVTAGRQIKEGDVLLVDISERDFRALKVSKKFLTKEDIDILKELAEIKRKENHIWGI